MAKALLMDEFHLSFFAPPRLAEAEYDTIHLTLNDARFLTDLRRTLRDVVRKYPSLNKVRLAITR